ncbi:MAG: DUF6653 family protein [Cyanobacteria bacterium P01_E01_bin.42]
MNYAQNLAHFFQMTDRVWERHANPWSVWTRYLSLPFLIVAIWSRVWWGWLTIAPIAMVLLWIWLNPRLFPKPQTTQNWTSKAVFGERVWLNRATVPIPKHHDPIIIFTNTVNAIGFLICTWGLITIELWPTCLGLSWVILGKTWFLDRMVWLYEEMKEKHLPYRDWLY